MHIRRCHVCTYSYITTHVLHYNGFLIHQIQRVENIKVYDQLMTPEWIKSNAEITGTYNVTQSYFEILPTTSDNYHRAL